MYTQNAQADAVSEINVTPLIDVMLCLLIIFMIAVPTMTHLVPLDLPQHVPPVPEAVKPEPPIQVRILADGRLLLDQKLISAHMLSAELAYQVGRDKRRILAVDAHQDARYEQVLQVLADARDQGITRIAMQDATPVTR